MTRLRRVAARTIAVLGIVGMASLITGVLVVRSGWFRERVRQRIITEIEKATGSRVELGNFSFKWETLTATISPLVLHGTEPPGESPFLRVESVVVGLRVISALERKVDLAFLRIDRPQMRIVYYADGSTNLPSPRTRSGLLTESLIKLAVRRYEVVNGTAEVDLRQVPLDFRGEDLRLTMNYDARSPRYMGEIASRHLHVAWTGAAPVEFDMAATFALLRDRVDFSRLRLLVGRSRIDLAGSLTDLRTPRGTFKTQAVVAMRDVVPIFSLPLSPVGSGSFTGDVAISFAGGFRYSITGRANASGVGYTRDRLKIENATASANVRWTWDLLTLRDLSATALGAKITGDAQLALRKDFHFQGNFEGLGIREAANVLTNRAVPWSGTMAGALVLDAVIGQVVGRLQATASITPGRDGTPIQGQLAINYDQRRNTLELGNSHLATAATSVDVSGTLGQTLTVRARSINLDDVLPALAMLSDAAPKTLPLKLNGGEATVNGTVSGKLDDPQFRGQASVGKGSLDGHPFDLIISEVDASRRAITLRRLSVSRGVTQLSGDVGLSALNGSFFNGAVSGTVNVRNAQLGELAKEAGVTAAISGTASATARLSGVLPNPDADIALDVTKGGVEQETFDRLRVNLHYAARSLGFAGGEADLGSSKLLFSGTFDHPENDWKNGDLHADVTAQGLTASRLTAFKQSQPDLDGRIDGKGTLEARIEKGQLTLRSFTGDVSARGVTFDREPLGDVTVHSETRGNELALRASAQLRDASVQGQGTWRLDGDEPGSGTLRVSRISVATLHDLVMIGSTSAEKNAAPPFEGFLEGGATFTVALLKPKEFQAQVRIDALQLNAKPSQALRLGVQAQDIVVRNTEPIVLDLSANQARVRSARFSARETNLEISGAVPFDSKTGADLAVKGTVNLAILQLLNPDLLARGSAAVSATIRGSLRDPEMTGQMELNGASVYLNDVPSGIDSANGVILFDRNRATIQTLTAQVGGGQIAFRGFLEFGQPLIYRLQAEVRQVRVRYPEDFSLTSNAQLSLNGTSETSLLSGSLTLNRAAITAGADAGRLLAQSAVPTPESSSSNDLLRGVRFDVRIESSPTFELTTSLARDIQASVDLRLRGTPLRPVLLGDISISSGEIQFFGNRYTVNRGDIRFLNPVKLEPTLDVNLETKARGVRVAVSLTGSPARLDVNYSSDPPLRQNEIIALLAVGRDPSTTTTGFVSTQASSSSSFAQAGGLLGEAVSEQLSSRVQRFFGASRVKIDPTVTGVDNLPEARLTIDQQISRDVTLTYITNLNRTQEQIVRVQWDLNPQWSAIAVRDSNGTFGIDFQYRKSFK